MRSARGPVKARMVNHDEVGARIAEHTEPSSMENAASSAKLARRRMTMPYDDAVQDAYVTARKD